MRRSVCRSVCHTLLFCFFLRFLALLLLPKWSGDLTHGPCPLSRDWGSRVSGLVQLHHSLLRYANAWSPIVSVGLSVTICHCQRTEAKEISSTNVNIIVHIAYRICLQLRGAQETEEKTRFLFIVFSTTLTLTQASAKLVCIMFWWMGNKITSVKCELVE